MNNNHPPTVMVVEADEQQREELAGAVRRAGFGAVTCADGEQALMVLQRRSVEAIVTELDLPGLRGDVLVRQAHATSPETVILVHTACAQIDRIIDVFRSGARDYLRKPLRPDELVFRLKRLLMQRAIAHEDRDLNADTGTHGGGLADESGSNLRHALRGFEKRHILQVLQECALDKHAAAAALGIGLSSLYRKMDEFGIPTRTMPHDAGPTCGLEHAGTSFAQ